MEEGLTYEKLAEMRRQKYRDGTYRFSLTAEDEQGNPVTASTLVTIRNKEITEACMTLITPDGKWHFFTKGVSADVWMEPDDGEEGAQAAAAYTATA